MNCQNKSKLVDVMKFVLRKVLSVVQCHSYLLESDDGITVRSLSSVFGPGRDRYQYCPVLCLCSRGLWHSTYP